VLNSVIRSMHADMFRFEMQMYEYFASHPRVNRRKITIKNIM